MHKRDQNNNCTQTNSGGEKSNSMSRQTITNKASHLYWIIYKAWFSTVFSFSNLISHSSLIEYIVTFLIWCLQCRFIWMPFTRTISFNKWHFEESVAAAWHVLVNSNLTVAGVLKYQGLKISSARVLKVINWSWMLWNYKRFRLKRCNTHTHTNIIIYIKIYTLQWTKTYSRSFRKSVTGVMQI